MLNYFEFWTASLDKRTTIINTFVVLVAILTKTQHKGFPGPELKAAQRHAQRRSSH